MKLFIAMTMILFSPTPVLLAALGPDTPITITLGTLATILIWTTACVVYIQRSLRRLREDIRQDNQRDMRILVYVFWSRKAQEKIVDRFRETNPGVKVESVAEIMREVSEGVIEELEREWDRLA